MLWIILALIAIVTGWYYYIWYPGQFWKKRGVPFKRSLPLPLFFIWNHFRGKSFAEITWKQYDCDSKVLGTFAFGAPSIMIRDPQLLRIIGIKDFDHFLNHSNMFFGEDDSIIFNNLFALKDQKWKNMRATLSPSFTGSKMRGMFHFMSECGEQLAKFNLDKQRAQGIDQPLEVELKDLFTRFTNDVIASTAFGIKVDSFKDPNNVFFEMGIKTSVFRIWRLIFTNLLPRISRLLGISIFSSDLEMFFKKLVTDTIAHRERENIIRPDMIHLLMESKKGRLHHEDSTQEKDTGFAVVQESQVGKTSERLELTDDDITAQALIFFIAGFETASVSMCFATYELAVNPDLQRRLQEEIDDTLAECGGKITYAALQKMQFLDCVITESLRKWPPAISADRACNKPYTLKVDDQLEISIDTKMVLGIPIYGIHRDPKYYPNPEKFDPDRFNEQNKDKIVPFTYLPFGIGPRNCIGSRFALMEAKLALFHLFSNFNVVPSPKSHIPLVLKPNSGNMTAKHGFWFGLEPRK